MKIQSTNVHSTERLTGTAVLFDRYSAIGLDEGKSGAAAWCDRASEGRKPLASHESVGNMGSQATIRNPVAVACRAAPDFQDWLAKAAGVVAVSTHQAGKVALIGWDGWQATLLTRDFDEPLGPTARGDRSAGRRDAPCENARQPACAGYDTQPLETSFRTPETT